jgi:hypothetical protein
MPSLYIIWFGKNLWRNGMTTEEMDVLYQKIYEGGKVAVSEAIARHRKIGEAIAVWQDGKVVILEADRIPPKSDC